MPERRAATPAASPATLPPSRLPVSAWVLAWSFLIDQLVAAGERGVRDTDGIWLLVSVALGGLLVWWVSAGVLTARTGRLVVVWVLIGISVVGYGALVVVPGANGQAGWTALHLATSLVHAGSLFWFTRSDYFAWQRTRPQVAGPAIAPILAIAVVVGAMGGLVDGPGDSGLRVQFDI